MKVHRFIGSFSLSDPVLRVSDQAIIHRWTKVLRLRVGEKIVLCDGAMNEAEAIIRSIDHAFVDLDLSEVFENTRELPVDITLYLSVLKRELFDLVVEKATELGVAKIVPILAARTIKQGVKIDRLHHLAHEAAEQSGRGIVPFVEEPVPFDVAIQQAVDAGMVYFFDTDAPVQSPDSSMFIVEKESSVFIGPEGGWTDDERNQARTLDQVTFRSLGRTILRAETAAIVAMYDVASRIASEQ